MSKAVRWQVPFAAHDGTQYRVDIYDEGYSGDPVTLTAGATPFVTDENDSDDFFEPVRSQTGTLQICTKIPSGGMLKLDDILPANNIARPVRLMKIAANNTETIEWQGFLSCEAYSQDYVGIPHTLSLSLLSVLEAMDSVQVNIDRMTGIEKVHKILYAALHEIDIQSGMTNFVNVHYDSLSSNILNKYLDQSNLYKIKECGGYEQVISTLDATMCKKVVNTICSFMGWVCREQGTDIYFQRNEDNSEELRRQTLAAFGTSVGSYTSEDVTETAMATAFADKWMGKGHKRSIAAGAKSIEITANVDAYNLEMTLPECPRQSLVTNPEERWYKWGEYHANSIYGYYNYASFQSIRMNIWASSDHNDSFEASMTVLQSLQYGETMLWKDVNWYTDMEYLAPPTGTKSGSYTDYTTAFLNVASGFGGGYTEGLMVIAEPYEFYYGHNSNVARGMELGDDIDASYFLYKQRSVRGFYATDGTIKIQVGQLGYITMFNGFQRSDSSQYSFVSPQLLMGIKWGNKWAYIDRSGVVPQYKWGTGFHSFYMPLDSENGLEFPITAANNGEVTVYIFPIIKGRVAGGFAPSGAQMDDTISGVRLTSIDISYVPSTSVIKNDGTENKYFRLLKTNFRDEISVNLDIASDLNNNMSPSILLNNSTTPAKSITMDGVEVKPEVDLLNRMATYYGAARQRLELEVAHPSTALPLLKLNGINDGKVYLPLAESRDWRTGVCKLTCFECPQ